MLRSQKRVKGLCAPTGFGKTLVYLMYALITNQPTCFVTDNRALQDQLMEDGACVGLVDIRGRRNYPCDLRNDYTCEMGYAAKCPKKGTIHCPSSQAEMRASVSRLVVTNYDKWTSARKYGQGMQHFTQVVFDEGHEAPAALARAMSIELNRKEIEDTLGVDFLSPNQVDDMVNWREWAVSTRAEAEAELTAARQRLADNPHTGSVVRHYNHMKNLVKRLGILATANPINWVADEMAKDGGHVFDPIRPGRYAEAALLLRVPSIVVISATLRMKTLFMMGISRESLDFIEFDSDFDPKRCPIYYVPTMRVDSRAGDLARLWILHDQIAARRTDRKAITHTVSYARRDTIVAASRFGQFMLINPQGEAATEIVQRFKASPPGTILVSPSVGAGFDFPGKECEWQFVCKIPFPNGQTKIHKARQDDDKEYGAYLAMNKMVQAFGRGPRSREDQCEGFIGDEHLDWFMPRFGHLAPKYFHRFFKRVTSVPPPLARLV